MHHKPQDSVQMFVYFENIYIEIRSIRSYFHYTVNKNSTRMASNCKLNSCRFLSTIKPKINLFHISMLSIHLKVQKLTERKINCVPRRKRKPNFVLASKSIMIRTQCLHIILKMFISILNDPNLVAAT